RAVTAYRTWGLALAPSTASGHQLCASASEGCRAVCLHYQGHAVVFESIHAARLAKAVAFVEHREWFESQLKWEVTCPERLGRRRGFTPALRLNLVSDV